MASVTVAGSVVCREGQEPVSFKAFDNGECIASFSVVDKEYVYAKTDEERLGQFYRAEVRGRAAEIVADRIKRGDRIAVHGQLVQRMYNDKLYLDIRSAHVTFLEGRQEGKETPF